MANDGGQTVPRIARAEHIGPNDTGDNIEAKRVANYVWNGSDWERESNTGGVSSTVTDPRVGYGVSNIEEGATYKYFGFEDADGKWYILRKTLATDVYLYAKGASAYTTAWTNRASHTYDTFDNTFSPLVGTVITSATTLDADITGNTIGLATEAKQDDGNALINDVKSNTTWTSSDFYPAYNSNAYGGAPPATDPIGAMVTRGAVLTDEGTNRTNFNGSTVGSSPGTATFTNGSATVTGAGFESVDVHWPKYIKLSTDAESAWAQIYIINSDTEITLTSPYTGAGGTDTYLTLGAKPSTGSGGTIAVGSGVMTLASGTTATSVTSLTSTINNGSNVFQTAFALSQRIANMTIYAGFEEDIAATVKQFARFSFTGTTNTTVVCETAYHPITAPSASETETTTVTLPGGLTTASEITYKVEMQFEQVVFSINDVVVAQHSKRIPHTATAGNNTLTAGVRLVNGTTPASSTTMTLAYMFTKVYNRLDVYQGNPTVDGGSDGYFMDAVTNTVTVTSAKGRLFGFSAINLNSAPAYIQVFDTTGAVTLGTTVPRYVFPIPANSTAANGAAADLITANGFNIVNGIKIACTTTAKGATPVGTGISGTLLYRNL